MRGILGFSIFTRSLTTRVLGVCLIPYNSRIPWSLFHRVWLGTSSPHQISTMIFDTSGSASHHICKGFLSSQKNVCFHLFFPNYLTGTPPIFSWYVFLRGMIILAFIFQNLWFWIVFGINKGKNCIFEGVQVLRLQVERIHQGILREFHILFMLLWQHDIGNQIWIGESLDWRLLACWHLITGRKQNLFLYDIFILRQGLISIGRSYYFLPTWASYIFWRRFLWGGRRTWASSWRTYKWGFIFVSRGAHFSWGNFPLFLMPISGRSHLLLFSISYEMIIFMTKLTLEGKLLIVQLLNVFPII